MDGCVGWLQAASPDARRATFKVKSAFTASPAKCDNLRICHPLTVVIALTSGRRDPPLSSSRQTRPSGATKVASRSAPWSVTASLRHSLPVEKSSTTNGSTLPFELASTDPLKVMLLPEEAKSFEPAKAGPLAARAVLKI